MIVFVLLGILAPWLFGYSICVFLKKQKFIERLCLSFALGFGSVNLIMFIENQYFNVKYDFANSLTIVIFFFIISVVAMAMKRERILEDLADMTNLIKNSLSSSKISISYFLYFSLLCLILGLIAIILYKALFFPIVEWDAVYYHAYISKQVFLMGNLPTQVGSSYMEYVNAYPTHLVLQHVWLYTLNNELNDVLARLISPIYGILILALTFDICKKLFQNLNIAAVSVIVLLCNPVFIHNAIVVNNDIIVVFYCLLSLVFFLKFLHEKHNEYLVLSGIILGFGELVKYTVLAFALPLSIVLFWFLITSRSKILKRGVNQNPHKSIILNTPATKATFSFLIPLILVPLPFYLRNFLFFGNPVYPYFFSIFGGLDLDKWILSEEYIFGGYISSFHLIFPLTIARYLNIFIVFLYLLSITKFSKCLVNQKIVHVILIILLVVCYVRFVGPYMNAWRFFLVAIPLISIFATKRLFDMVNKLSDQKLVLGLLSFIFFCALLYILVNSMRLEQFSKTWLLYYIFPVLCAILILMYMYFETKPFKTKANVFLLFLIFMVMIAPSYFTGLEAKYDLITSKPPFVRDHPSEELVIVSKLGDLYIVQKWINNNLSSDAKILSFEDRRYYLDREIVPADSVKVKRIYTSPTLEGALDTLQQLNITYVLTLAKGEFAPLYKKSIIHKNLNNSTVFKLIYQKDDIRLYSIQYP